MGKPDVLVRDLGTAWVFSPATDEAKAWFKANIVMDGLWARHWDGGEFAVSKDGGADRLDQILASDLTIGGSHD
jgi:hypothetical protein